MTKIRIRLTADNFRTLVSGGEVSFDDHDMAHSHGFDFDLPSGDDIKVIPKDNGIDYEVGLRDRITIILEDMEWADMAAMIEEIRHGDAATQAIKARDWKILNDDSLWNFGVDQRGRKP